MDFQPQPRVNGRPLLALPLSTIMQIANMQPQPPSGGPLGMENGERQAPQQVGTEAPGWNPALPGRADGGPVAAGETVDVGEKGPEWFQGDDGSGATLKPGVFTASQSGTVVANQPQSGGGKATPATPLAQTKGTGPGISPETDLSGGPNGDTAAATGGEQWPTPQLSHSASDAYQSGVASIAPGGSLASQVPAPPHAHGFWNTLLAHLAAAGGGAVQGAAVGAGDKEAENGNLAERWYNAVAQPGYNAESDRIQRQIADAKAALPEEQKAAQEEDAGNRTAATVADTDYRVNELANTAAGKQKTADDLADEKKQHDRATERIQAAKNTTIGMMAYKETTDELGPGAEAADPVAFDDALNKKLTTVRTAETPPKPPGLTTAQQAENDRAVQADFASHQQAALAADHAERMKFTAQLDDPNSPVSKAISAKPLSQFGMMSPHELRSGQPADKATNDAYDAAVLQARQAAIKAFNDQNDANYGQAMDALYALPQFARFRPSPAAAAPQSPTAPAMTPAAQAPTAAAAAAGPTPAGGQGAQPHPVGSIISPDVLGVTPAMVAAAAAHPNKSITGSDGSKWKLQPGGFLKRIQ